MRDKLMKIFEWPLRFAFRLFYSRPRWILQLFKNRNELCFHESYFPDEQRKLNLTIFIDQALQVIKYGYANDFYFPYGFDVKNKQQMDEYLHYAPFMKMRDSRNIRSHSSTAVLRDKVLFGMFTSYYGVDSAENLAISRDKKLFNITTKTFQSVRDFFSNIEKTDLFLKPIDGECGNGIYHLMIADNRILMDGKETKISEIEKILLSSPYLIQTTVSQHTKMRSLHPLSLNTIRLVTIRNIKTGEVEVFPSILRIGTGDSIVDNTSQGGLAVGIYLDSGRLKDFGFYKPNFGTKVSIHPDSGIKFSDFSIPYFSECKRLALFLHSQLRDIHSIGWDIAIGENGPVFVEGNDNWEINGPQICNGGLKKEFLRLCGE